MGADSTGAAIDLLDGGVYECNRSNDLACSLASAEPVVNSTIV